MPHPHAGTQVAPRQIDSVQGPPVAIPAAGFLHLQFRRYAGCPICNLHLQSFARRHEELRASGITLAAVFHSSRESLAPFAAALPFALIADPDRVLYREFGVGRSLRAVLDPRAWPTALRGVLRHGVRIPGRGESPFGLCADVLLDARARIVALRHGTHAADHWEVDEMLAIAASTAPDDDVALDPAADPADHGLTSPATGVAR